MILYVEFLSKEEKSWMSKISWSDQLLMPLKGAIKQFVQVDIGSKFQQSH